MPTETLRAFVERNRERHSIDEPFPFKALEKLARRAIDETEIALLIALLDLVGRYDDRTGPEGRNLYEGQDLRRKAEVVAALGGCGDAHARRIAELVATIFRPVMRERSYANPGSPDLDKFDRDTLVESSEDALALACIRALARIDVWSVEARSALSDARRHRSHEVSELARQMMTHLAAHEGPVPKAKSLSAFHKFVVDSVVRQRAGWTPAPESEERIAAAEQTLGRPLPKDYRAFLGEIGRIPWPFEIGNVLDYKRDEWPAGFVPFGLSDTEAFGFLLMPRGPTFEGLEADLERRHAKRTKTTTFARSSTPSRKRSRSFARIARSARESNGKATFASSASASTKKKLGPFDDDDDEDFRESFEVWLKVQVEVALDEIADALEDNASETERKRERAKEVAAQEEERAYDASNLRRAIDLVDHLVAEGALEVDDSFDDEACAKVIEGLLGDAKRLSDALLSCAGVAELFASEDDLERLIAHLDGK